MRFYDLYWVLQDGVSSFTVALQCSPKPVQCLATPKTLAEGMPDALDRENYSSAGTGRRDIFLWLNIT